MLKSWEFWTLTTLALLAAIFMVANGLLFMTVRAVQLEVSARQEYIQQSVQLEPLYREIVKALADLSVRNQDEGLKELLSGQGISVTVNAPSVPPDPSLRK